MSSDTKPRDPGNELTPRARPLRSLAFRINAWYVGMFVASLAALVAFAVPTVRDALDHAEAVVLEDRIERHVAMLSTGLPAYQTALETAIALGEPEVPVRIRDRAGHVLYQRGELRSARFTTERMTGELHLEIGAPEAPWSAVVDRLRPRAIVLTVCALVLAVAGGSTLTRRGLRPVRELTATAREVIRSGDLSRRVPVRGSGDELDEVSVLFNRMLERNEALVASMREALDDVAHDLRTPLTRLRGTAEVALRTNDADASREALAVCIEESDHVLVMLRALMDISEAETGIMRLDKKPVSLGKLASDVAGLYEQVAEDAGVELSVTERDAVTVLADAARLRQAIANIVDNGIKYTPRGGNVAIEVARDHGDAVIRIRDSGEGIPDAALPRIWDRLYRGEPSRTKPGLGLGLSLVKAIVTAHGGRVTVESRPDHGSTFTIVLPATAAAQRDEPAPLTPA